MEDWKIKISVLWLIGAVAILAHQILVLMEPGIITQLMAGEAEGQKIGPELILFFAILMLVPLVMAFLSLTLKDSMNRRVNIVVGAVFAVLWFVGVVDAADCILGWGINDARSCSSFSTYYMVCMEV